MTASALPGVSKPEQFRQVECHSDYISQRHRSYPAQRRTDRGPKLRSRALLALTRDNNHGEHGEKIRNTKWPAYAGRSQLSWIFIIFSLPVFPVVFSYGGGGISPLALNSLTRASWITMSAVIAVLISSNAVSPCSDSKLRLWLRLFHQKKRQPSS